MLIKQKVVMVVVVMAMVMVIVVVISLKLLKQIVHMLGKCQIIFSQGTQEHHSHKHKRHSVIYHV